MAAIREELILADRFSSTFSRFLRMGREAEELLRRLGAGQGGYNEAVRRSTAALEEMAGASRHTNELLEQMSRDLHALREGSSGAAGSQERLNRSFRSGASAAGSLTGKIRNLAAAYIGLRGIKAFTNLSDTWTQTTARMERMNDGRQTTPELQDMIFQAAQRSRGDYQETANMVAKLGTLAADAFGSTEEVVAFAEQINKQFALAGTSAQGMQAAMLQLTQAMGSGVLRGEELNSILEQAPTITKSIADYLGVSVGEMRNLAKEGALTADVVKAAIFAAAEETNKAFEAVPLTFSQAGTMLKNEMLNAFRPALEQLNGLLNSDIGQAAINGLITGVRLLGRAIVGLIELVETAAQWVMDNWEAVSTVLIGGAVGIAAVMAASAAASAAAWITVNWPLMLVVGGIALVIYKAREMGATWEEVGTTIGGIVGVTAAFIHNVIADLWNLFAIFAEFLANLFIDPLNIIARQFFDVFDWILSLIQSVASALDAVFGGNLTNLVAGFRGNVKNLASTLVGENKIKIERMEHIDYGAAWNKWSTKGRDIGSAVDNFKLPDIMSSVGGKPFDYAAMLESSGMPAALDDIGKDTKAIKKSVSLADEDIKLLVDLAEREYITNVNLTAQTPVINVSGQNTGNTEMDQRMLANAIKTILIEEAASHTDLSYT